MRKATSTAENTALTLLRGLAVIDCVSSGAGSVAGISAHLDLSQSVVRRLLVTLLAKGFVRTAPSGGYWLGETVLSLAHDAGEQMVLLRKSRDILRKLALETGDVASLAVIDGDHAHIVGVAAGHRRLVVHRSVGERNALISSSLGKALLLDAQTDALRQCFIDQSPHRRHDGLAGWMDRMGQYRALGYTLDLGEDDDGVRCVGAPVRDATDRIVAAISVSAPAHAMDAGRLLTLGAYVEEAARAASHALGQRPPAISTLDQVPHRDTVTGATGFSLWANAL